MLGIKKAPGESQDQIKAETELIVSGNNGDSMDTGEGLDKSEGGQCRFRWRPTSKSLLSAAEKKILSFVKTPYKGKFVNVGPTVGKHDSEIWTISHTENESDKTPLVLVHGFASGVAMWALNLDELAAKRPVYAIDLLGFARSSRPNFSSDPQDAERELAQSIEAWRQEMKLERFVLVGHSMGGFLATSYAIRYPSRVSHLVLADPWGYSDKPKDLSERYPLAWWVKAIGFVISPLNPLAGIRAAGPWGPKIIERARNDLNEKFSVLSEEGNVSISEYIYHCNAQKPTGESAFHTLQNSFGWAKNPMIHRIHTLREDVPMTLLYGSRSWVDHCSNDKLQEQRPGSYVNVQILDGAGHHVYADTRQEFNKLVLDAAAFADKNDANRDMSPA